MMLRQISDSQIALFLVECLIRRLQSKTSDQEVFQDSVQPSGLKMDL